MSLVWLNGEIQSAAEATIPALDRGVLWGFGLFETMRAYGSRVWAFDEHYRRLCKGGETVGLSVPQPADLRAALDEVLRANSLEDAGVRVTITAGAGPPDPQADPDRPPNVLVTAWALRDYTALYRDGVALITVAGGGRPLAGVKTTSYAVSVAGRVLARRAGADDALFVGADGRVLEATGSNLFVLREGHLSTPPLSEAVLPGITRGHVIEVAKRSGFEVDERELVLDELFTAEEVLLTSSLRELYPVRAVDDRDVKRGAVIEELRNAYHSAVLEQI